MSVRRQSPSYLCAAGHPIVAACAIHGDHFLFGHQCPSDGRYWVADPCSSLVADGDDHAAACAAVRR